MPDSRASHAEEEAAAHEHEQGQGQALRGRGADAGGADRPPTLSAMDFLRARLAGFSQTVGCVPAASERLPTRHLASRAPPREALEVVSSTLAELANGRIEPAEGNPWAVRACCPLGLTVELRVWEIAPSLLLLELQMAEHTGGGVRLSGREDSFLELCKLLRAHPRAASVLV